MKKFYYLILFLVVLTSCLKQEESNVPIEQEPISQHQELLLEGTWLLTDGNIYLTNLETNQKTYYNHFGYDKLTSSLRFLGSRFNFEDIELDITTWTFKNPNPKNGMNEFVLNGDDKNPYGLNITGRYVSITEHPNLTDKKLGGSARPLTIEVKDLNNNEIYVYVQEQYFSMNNINYKSFNKLTFRKITN